MKVPANIYCYAICHGATERWYAPANHEDGGALWVDDLNRANVWHASDIEAEGWDAFPLPLHAHWVALTWDDYALACGIEDARTEPHITF